MESCKGLHSDWLQPCLQILHFGGPEWLCLYALTLLQQLQPLKSFIVLAPGVDLVETFEVNLLTLFCNGWFTLVRYARDFALSLQGLVMKKNFLNKMC